MINTHNPTQLMILLTIFVLWSLFSAFAGARLKDFQYEFFFSCFMFAMVNITLLCGMLSCLILIISHSI